MNHFVEILLPFSSIWQIGIDETDATDNGCHLAAAISNALIRQPECGSRGISVRPGDVTVFCVQSFDRDKRFADFPTRQFCQFRTSFVLPSCAAWAGREWMSAMQIDLAHGLPFAIGSSHQQFIVPAWWTKQIFHDLNEKGPNIGPIWRHFSCAAAIQTTFSCVTFTSNGISVGCGRRYGNRLNAIDLMGAENSGNWIALPGHYLCAHRRNEPKLSLYRRHHTPTFAQQKPIRPFHRPLVDLDFHNILTYQKR